MGIFALHVLQVNVLYKMKKLTKFFRLFANFMGEDLNMEKSVIESHKKPVQVSSWLFNAWRRAGTEFGCSICEVQLVVKDKAFLLLNNNKLFTNCFIHQRCWTEKTDEILKNKYAKNGWTEGFCTRRR